MIGRYSELVFYRAWAELRSEASRSYLGMIWWFLEPVLYMAVFYLVFGLGLKQGDEGFVAFLLCALVPWKWLDGTVRAASGSIAGSVGLMQQVYLPKIVLPLIVIGTNAFKFLIVLVLLLLFFAWDGVVAFQSWVFLPAVVFSQGLLILAVSCWGAALVPLLPDLRYLISNGMTLLFFMSGIFYKIEYLDQPIRDWLGYNPVLILLNAYRSVLLYGQAPDWPSLAIIATFSVAALGLAIGLLWRCDRYYPRVVG